MTVDTPSEHQSGRPVAEAPSARTRVLDVIANVIRGMLIGMAELVPGVSGGTVALVIGIYERALGAATQLLDVAKTAVAGPDRRSGVARKVTAVDWWLLVGVGVGMVGMVFTLASTLSDFVENQQEIAYGLFFGMIVVSIAVPVMMARSSVPATGAWRGVLYVLAGAVVGFGLASLSEGSASDPAPWMIVGAASIAICALVLPGLSGSYLLLAMGLYAPTLRAVSDRDLGYIALFALGAILGLVVFVKVLETLLTRARFATLLVMAGCMVGSLRALWPWQGEDGSALAPGENWLAILGFAVLGGAVVLAILVAERKFGKGSLVSGSSQAV